MSTILPEKDLPTELTPEQSVEQAYARELAEVASKLNRGLPTLIECDKDLAPFVFLNLRTRLREFNMRCRYLDGRPRENEQQGPVPVGLMGTMINQLRDAVRGATEQVDNKGQPVRTVIVLPHLDLLTTSQGGLTGEAREVIVLLYENPTIVFLGFKDPSFQLPKVIESLFPHRTSLLGIARDRLRHLVTQKESRKFGRQFNPWGLYKYVSGVNAVRLRKLLSTLEGEDYPADPRQAFRQLRQATLTGSLEIPELSLDSDIGGYDKVKQRLRHEILDVLARRDAATTEDEVSRLEDLIPRGMIFWGPPGTGKTYFAKAMAAAIGAAITVVSGPELKSKWVGESEENLRQIFYKARQSAPSIIVFDEIDSFATARGTYTGSGVEHSMVNQLLTEMDGFHKEELVFIVGTTNFVESLDPALLRPGRFEFHLHIPYPEADDRREILKIYDKKMRLEMTDAAIDFAVRRTNDFVIGAAAGTRYSGDHLNALCRSIARLRLRDNITGPTEADLVERALTEWVDRPKMTPQELTVLATHEAGHAVVSLHCPHAPAIERITIASEMQWAFGYVRHSDPAHRYIQTVNYYLDMICVALGAREAEKVFLSDISLGATGDLQSATMIARELVEVHGYGGGDVVQYRRMDERGIRHPDLSPKLLEELDERVRAIVEEQRVRAEKIIAENKAMVATLRDLLLEHKTIDAKVLTELAPEKAAKKKR
ncbi:MAG: AAA family ATPase [Zavarzinella sp.]|nr:AAA family ATPase [Zavarzinella sp.]